MAFIVFSVVVSLVLCVFVPAAIAKVRKRNTVVLLAGIPSAVPSGDHPVDISVSDSFKRRFDDMASFRKKHGIKSGAVKSSDLILTNESHFMYQDRDGVDHWSSLPYFPVMLQYCQHCGGYTSCSKCTPDLSVPACIDSHAVALH